MKKDTIIKMKNFNQKHNAMIKSAHENDAEYAALHGTDELHELIQIVLKTDEEELKKLVDLQ